MQSPAHQILSDFSGNWLTKQFISDDGFIDWSQITGRLHMLSNGERQTFFVAQALDTAWPKIDHATRNLIIGACIAGAAT